MDALLEVIGVLKTVSKTLGPADPDTSKTRANDSYERLSPPGDSSSTSEKVAWCINEIELIAQSRAFSRRDSSFQISDEEQKLVNAAKQLDGVGDFILTYMDDSAIENIAQNTLREDSGTLGKKRAKSLPPIFTSESLEEVSDLDDDDIEAVETMPAEIMKALQSNFVANDGYDSDDTANGNSRASSNLTPRSTDDATPVNLGTFDGLSPPSRSSTEIFEENPDHHEPLHASSPVVLTLKSSHDENTGETDSPDEPTRQSLPHQDSKIFRGSSGFGLNKSSLEETVTARLNSTVSTHDVKDVPFATEMQNGESETPKTTDVISFTTKSAAPTPHTSGAPLSRTKTGKGSCDGHQCNHSHHVDPNKEIPEAPAMPREEVKRSLLGETISDEYAPVLAQVEEILKDINDWNIDIFGLAALTDAPLALLGLRIFEERNLIEELTLDRVQLINFFWKVEESYHHYPEIKFHNNMHAADVMHSTHVLLSHASLQGAFSDIEIFSAIVAACVHDCQHFGRTNGFLIKTSHDLAMRYNDLSVLENFHLSEAFKIVKDPACNIFSKFTQDEYLVIRKLIIDMVLSTDMAKHAKFLGEFRALQQNLEETNETNDNPTTVVTQLIESFSNRVLVLCAVVHNADLGNPTKTWVVCRTWAERLLEEFFEEGDAERNLGLPLGALNDRDGVVTPKSQVGFLSFVVSPLWNAWSDYVNIRGTEEPQLVGLAENLIKWQELANAPKHDLETNTSL